MVIGLFQFFLYILLSQFKFYFCAFKLKSNFINKNNKNTTALKMYYYFPCDSKAIYCLNRVAQSHM